MCLPSWECPQYISRRIGKPIALNSVSESNFQVHTRVCGGPVLLYLFVQETNDTQGSSSCSSGKQCLPKSTAMILHDTPLVHISYELWHHRSSCGDRITLTDGFKPRSTFVSTCVYDLVWPQIVQISVTHQVTLENPMFCPCGVWRASE